MRAVVSNISRNFVVYKTCLVNTMQSLRNKTVRPDDNESVQWVNGLNNTRLCHHNETVFCYNEPSRWLQEHFVSCNGDASMTSLATRIIIYYFYKLFILSEVGGLGSTQLTWRHPNKLHIVIYNNAISMQLEHNITLHLHCFNFDSFKCHFEIWFIRKYKQYFERRIYSFQHATSEPWRV